MFFLYLRLWTSRIITFVPSSCETQDEDDEDEGEEEGGGGLSKSGKELKKLLGKANGLDESDAEDDDDDDDVSFDLLLVANGFTYCIIYFRQESKYI